MQDWKAITLSQLGRIITGKTPPTSDVRNWGGAIPFVTPTDMDGRRSIDSTLRCLTASGVASVSSSQLQKRAVAVSCIGSDMGKAAIVAAGSVTNQQINSIIVDGDHNFLYVYYNLSGRKSEIKNLAGGAAQPILNKTDFGRLPFLLPPRNQQNSIAAVLDALDEKIALNRRINFTLDTTARAIFRDWFVDFAPAHAKKEGRDPLGIAPEIAALFPDKFDVNGLPEGWKFIPMGDALITLETGSRPKGGVKDIVTGVPSVGAESVTRLGHFDFLKTKFVSEEFFTSMRRGVIADRDVVLRGLL